jgi:Fungal protein of unknown function (DUF1752)/Nitrogen regulatory protein AreA N terminus
MSPATHAEERGGRAAIRAAALQPGSDDSTSMDNSDQLEYSALDEDKFQTILRRQQILQAPPNARDISTIPGTSIGGGKLDLSTQETIARNGLLRESVFPDWEDDAARGGIGSPDEMQKKDPLATQIWKLYSKTKTRLPNQERMENLTWRMMAMSLKRRELMQAMFVPQPLPFLGTVSDIQFSGRSTANRHLPVALRRCTNQLMIPMHPPPIP